jgi:uncharacterized protein
MLGAMLMTAAVMGSLWAWGELLWAVRAREPLPSPWDRTPVSNPPDGEVPSSGVVAPLESVPLAPPVPIALHAARRPRPRLAVAMCLGWIALNLLAGMLARPSEPPKAPAAADILFNGLVILSVGCSVWMLLFADGRYSLADFGCDLSGLREQLAVGQQIFLLAMAPTVTLLIVSIPFRSEETQHQHLQLLTHHPSLGIVVAIVLTACLFAPLCEELVFRVCLQGALSAATTPAIGVGTVAVVFCLVHGWRDAFVLLPLGLLLGVMYDRRGRYWELVAGHGLFNALNIALTMLAGG